MKVAADRYTLYFVVAATVHLVGVASRFDALAARLPGGAALALLLVQVPLLVLSGYFEGRLDYGPRVAALPRWMQIRSTPVKLAFTFGFIYLCCVALQTWQINLGPIDPAPPLAWPLERRALWFAMFTAGMFFPFYLAATAVLVPVLRAITLPLRALPPAVGAVLALVLGAGLGLFVMAALTSTQLGAFVAAARAILEANPAIGLGLSLGALVVPAALGLALGGERT